METRTGTLWQHAFKTFFVGRPTNMACHNICTDIEAPIGIEDLLLLSIGGNHCEKETKLNKKTLDNMFYR